MRTFILLLSAALALQPLAAREAEISESLKTIRTYPFSDPDPVAAPSHLYYPYFRFDGFASTAVDKQWKVVKLENDFIELSIFPEIGGKIWTAVDKTTGRDFLYNNHVVKFRDVAMRGPWTSGGIEFNFGIIGHAPTSSTPVDYFTKRKDDGSVNCYISSYEYITRTMWTVEVNLQPDKAYFTTTTTWHNSSAIPQPYYQWMNAGYGIDDKAEFLFPGTDYIGHGGDRHPFPIDEEGHNIAWYEGNNFGTSKSYHVLGKYNDFYGAYWHDKDYGSVHHATYDDKLGMKIWVWALSREGGIWEDLLTDSDGQYAELQSGRMYSQPATASSYTPFKHPSFNPLATDTWTEYWFPVKNTRGVVKASAAGALNVIREDGMLKLFFSPLEKLNTAIKIYDNDKLVQSIPMNCDILETWTDSIPLANAPDTGHLKLVIGDGLLSYSEVPEDNIINRPMELPADFDWDSAYGLFTQGQQWMNQKVLDKAEDNLLASLAKDHYFVPALRTLASLYYRQGRYDDALSHLRTALSINNYDGETNYLYGLCNKVLGHATDAKDGFSIASYSPAFRSAAYEKLAEMFLIEKDMNKAEHYCLRSLKADPSNLTSDILLAVIYRKTNRPEMAREILEPIVADLPLFHAARFELANAGKNGGLDGFRSLVRNELPFETFMELAEWYESIGCIDEALVLLEGISDYPVAGYRRAYLKHLTGDDDESKNLLEKTASLSPSMVFPFRPGSLKALDWAASVRPDWKIDYYRALIYWANQNTSKALELMDSCEAPDFAPFYLCRATLRDGEAALADIKTAEKIEPSWRTGIAMINQYMKMRQWDTAADVAQKYLKTYPENYYIALKASKALYQAGKLPQCIDILTNINLLPNEGSDASRTLYRSANLLRAMELIGKRDFRQAQLYVDASRLWPDNLGVGKPYDDMIDSRLEDYIEAQIYYNQGKPSKADILMQSIASAHRPTAHILSADLLTAIALRHTGKTQEAQELVKSWCKKNPDSRIARWCTAIYNNDYKTAATLIDGNFETEEVAPWETATRDNDFELIVSLFSSKWHNVSH